MGVCSTATVDGDRVYFVSHRFEVVCLDVNGSAGTQAGEARVLWSFDMQEKVGAFPCDAANGSPLIDGDLLYVQTSNGIDRNSFSNPQKEKDRKFPAPDAPNVIALDKRTGRLVATDETRIADSLLHGQWSSLCLGKVGGRKLLFFGGGDGCLLRLRGAGPGAEQARRLKTVWSYDCIPPEYKAAAGEDRITHYCLGDKRVKGTLNQHDGTFVGMSEIIGTPVLVKDRLYVALGRDPEHGRGRGALHCIDATGTGDITRSGRVWMYQGLDRTLSTASVADGLVYLSDVAGRLHCVDARDRQNAIGSTKPNPKSGARPWWRTAESTCPRQSTCGCSRRERPSRSWTALISARAFSLPPSWPTARCMWRRPQAGCGPSSRKNDPRYAFTSSKMRARPCKRSLVPAPPRL